MFGPVPPGKCSHRSAGSGLYELLILEDGLDLKAVVQSLMRSGEEWRPGEASPRQKQTGQSYPLSSVFCGHFHSS